MAFSSASKVHNTSAPGSPSGSIFSRVTSPPPALEAIKASIELACSTEEKIKIIGINATSPKIAGITFLFVILN